MSEYNFDRIIDRRKSGSVKWDLYEKDVLPLWVADMDFPVADEISAALLSRIDHPFFGYQKTDPEVLESICDWNWRRHQWKISSEDILLMPGVVSGFNWAAGALIDGSEAVAFQTPVYFPFYTIAKNQHIQQVEIPLISSGDGYQIDFDLFEESIKKDVRMFLLCNPHNPVGRVFKKEELAQIAEICLAHDVWICSDEIHSDLIFSGHKHIPIASLSPDLSDRTITLMAPSKTFNIPGLQFSYAVCTNKPLREKLEQERKGLLEHPNIFANTAARAAYQSGEPWLVAVLGYLERNRDFLISFLKEEIPDITCNVPEGTYLAWLNCSALELSLSPFAFFLNNACVAMSDGKMFGNSSGQFVRLNFACPRPILKDALKKMAEAVKSLRKN